MLQQLENGLLSVVNEVGKEAAVAILGPGSFFGEGSPAGQPVRMGTATAIIPSKRQAPRSAPQNIARSSRESDRAGRPKTEGHGNLASIKGIGPR